MTVAELKKLWEPAAQGKVTRWNQIRPEWPDQEIHLFGAGVDSGTFDYFTEAIVGKEGAEPRRLHLERGRQRHRPGRQRRRERARLLRLRLLRAEQGQAEAGRRSTTAMRANGAGPIAPSPETVANGTYRPLSRPVFIYAKVKALDRPEVKSFVDFYLDKGAGAGPRSRLHPAAPPSEQELVRDAVCRAQDRHDVHRDRQPQPGDPGTASQPIDNGADVATRAAGRRVRHRADAVSVRRGLDPGHRRDHPRPVVGDGGVPARGAAHASFLFGTVWTPLFFDKQFGVLPLVTGTLLASAIAMVVALPAGLLIADLPQ